MSLSCSDRATPLLAGGVVFERAGASCADGRIETLRLLLLRAGIGVHELAASTAHEACVQHVGPWRPLPEKHGLVRAAKVTADVSHRLRNGDGAAAPVGLEHAVHRADNRPGVLVGHGGEERQREDALVGILRDRKIARPHA